MYAVVRIGKHQYRVEPGKVITTQKLDAPVGSEVHFKDVLLVADGEAVKCGGETEAASAYGTIRSQGRARKIHVFKKKRRKGYTRSQGHRQPYTEIEITRIEV